MAYKVTNDFIDTTTSHHYKKGDVYPADGFSHDAERVTFLMKKHDKYKRAFVEEVKEQKPKQKVVKKSKEE